MRKMILRDFIAGQRVYRQKMIALITGMYVAVAGCILFMAFIPRTVDAGDAVVSLAALIFAFVVGLVLLNSRLKGIASDLGLVCPECGKILVHGSGRIAVATRNCCFCGATVLTAT